MIRRTCRIGVAALLITLGWLVALGFSQTASASAAGAAPVLTGSVSDPLVLSATVSVAVSGNYAYTTAYHAGELTAVDISNPANPTIAGSSAPLFDVNLIGGSNVTIAGGYAFVVSKNRNASTTSNDDGNGNSLTILDIHTNPAQPSIVGTVRDPGKLFGSYGIAVAGNYAYVAYQGLLSGQPSGPDTSSGGFSVIDLSAIGSPTIVANIDNGSLPAPYTGTNALEHATSVAISGNFAYVTAFYAQRVTVIDISAPTAPRIVASLADATNLPWPVDLAVQGNYLYVASQSAGTSNQFAIIDISTPSSPRVVSALSDFTDLSGAYRIRVRGNFAYVAASSAHAIAAIDVSNPAAPRVAGSVIDNAHLHSTTGLDLDSSGQYVVASSPLLSTQSNATYPPYPLQTGGGTNTGTISMIQLDPSPISVAISAASEPANPTTQSSASFTFAPSDAVSTLRCSLDGAPFAPCSTPTTQQYSSLSPGTHTFIVQATDTVGNTGSDSYSWVISASSVPSVSGVSPAAGPVTGGTTVTITGTGFTSGASVSFGGTPATSVTVVSGTSITADSPAHAAGSVNVTVTTPGGTSTTSPANLFAYGAPVNTSPPSISGSAKQGQTLSESHGTWTTRPTSYAYQWNDCDSTGSSCSAIAGATSQTYTLTAAEAGHTIRVQETATNSGGSSSPASSAATGVVQPISAPPIKPSNSSPPVISGTTTVGQTLTSSTGAWSGTPPISYSYQWSRCASACSPIAGATSSSYTLTNAELGAKVAVVVTTSNAAGSAGATSAQVGPVAAAGPTRGHVIAALLKALAVSGRSAKIGQLLRHGGYVISLTAPSIGRLEIDWYLVPNGAHLAKAKKPVLVARASVTFHHAGKAKVKVALTGKGRQLLKGAKHVKLTERGSFTPSGGTTMSKTKALSLKR